MKRKQQINQKLIQTPPRILGLPAYASEIEVVPSFRGTMSGEFNNHDGSENREGYSYNLQLHNLAVGQQSLARRKTALCMKGIKLRKRGYILESRPKGFKRKIWMGTYKREVDARIARDILTYYTEGQPTPQDFNFEYSTEVFAGLKDLGLPFESLHPSCTDDAHLKFAKELRKKSVECIEYNDDEKIRWTTWQRHGCIIPDNQNAPTNPSAVEESSESSRRLAIKQDWFEALPNLDHIPPEANLQDISQLVDGESPIFKGKLERPAANSAANSCELTLMISPRIVFDTGISPLGKDYVKPGCCKSHLPRETTLEE